ncbi:uncharacterized protein A4U43_C04F25560 [Asparagus officinalis]|uniref:Uncharacterized protein n=1 Tax=Asparagus officinalis TaxID=4686 RepID=A0A5P1F895_ASPOF|nr:uncharacterized protein A4U43_C04F25560 [Asparagus officinalis]
MAFKGSCSREDEEVAHTMPSAENASGSTSRLSSMPPSPLSGPQDKKASIWRLQEQRHCTRVKLIAGELTPEEFDLEDASLNARVQAEKEDVQTMQQEASAARVSDVQTLAKRPKRKCWQKHARNISEIKAYVFSFLFTLSHAVLVINFVINLCYLQALIICAELKLI